MGHDATKVLMGTTQSSMKVVDNYVADASAFPAGTAVYLKTDGTLSKAKADGNLLGISLGRDLSDTNKLAVCRSGLKVPVLLTDAFNPALGAQVHINDTTGIGGAADTGLTGVNAIYSSVRKVGISEAGSDVGCALIDFQGGL